MRIWVDTSVPGKASVNFQPENGEEQAVLDQLLGFRQYERKPIGDNPHKDVGQGACQVAVLGGHESQRWIIIDC